MIAIRRLALAVVLVALAAGLLFGQTQNAVPKYNGSGTLVDSVISEVNGDVGIGVTPGAGFKLRVAGQASFDTAAVNRNTNEGGALGLWNFSKTGSAVPNWTIFNTTGPYGDGLQFWSHPANGQPNPSIRRFVLADNGDTYMSPSGGNVGIGTMSPSSALHVIGDVTVTGNIAAKYQDVAEWVDAAEPAPPGTVMSLGVAGRDEVRRADRAYDTAVAGVVSPQPGVILGERGPGRVLVAHSGRVRVRVDATYGAIRAGDLLVTSPTPGHAMRSQPLMVGDAEFHRPGTLLGKAIEPLANGTGEILVLLTLQ
jgi:hypothetical protein